MQATTIINERKYDSPNFVMLYAFIFYSQIKTKLFQNVRTWFHTQIYVQFCLSVNTTRIRKITLTWNQN